MSAELKKAFDNLKKRFKTGVIEEKTVYYFSLGDDAGQKWTVTLTPSACTVKQGKVDNADCVLKTSADLFVKMVAGTWEPGVTDFMTGKIKSNDLERLKMLQNAFDL